MLSAALAALTRAHAKALIVLADPFMNLQRKTIVALATRHQLPTIFGFRDSDGSASGTLWD